MIKAVFSTSHTDLLAFQQRLEHNLQGEFTTRAAMSSIEAMVAHRVQNEGRKTDGSLIGGGKYSAPYAKYRAAKGRQTAFIDLTMTGGMMTTGFRPVPLGREGWGLGFINAHEYAKYEANTKRFGEFIQPSQEEIEISFRDVLNATQDAIDKSR